MLSWFHVLVAVHCDSDAPDVLHLQFNGLGMLKVAKKLPQRSEAYSLISEYSVTVSHVHPLEGQIHMVQLGRVGSHRELRNGSVILEYTQAWRVELAGVRVARLEECTATHSSSQRP